MANDTSCQSMNPDDYVVEGVMCKLVAGEDLKFGEYLKYSFAGDTLTVLKALDEDFLNDYEMRAGQCIQDTKKGDAGRVLLNGLIIPKKDYTVTMRKLREELLTTMFIAIGDAFGYDLSFKRRYDTSHTSKIDDANPEEFQRLGHRETEK